MTEAQMPFSADGVGEKPTPVAGYDPATYAQASEEMDWVAQQAAIDAHKRRVEARAASIAACRDKFGKMLFGPR